MTGLSCSAMLSSVGRNVHQHAPVVFGTSLNLGMTSEPGIGSVLGDIFTFSREARAKEHYVRFTFHREVTLDQDTLGSVEKRVSTSHFFGSEKYGIMTSCTKETSQKAKVFIFS